MSIEIYLQAIGLVSVPLGVTLYFHTQARIRRLANARDEYKRLYEDYCEALRDFRETRKGLCDESDQFFTEAKIHRQALNLIRAKIWGDPILENRNAIDVVNYIEGLQDLHRNTAREYGQSLAKIGDALRKTTEENNRLREELKSRNVPEGSLVEFPHQKTA